MQILEGKENYLKALNITIRLVKDVSELENPVQ